MEKLALLFFLLLIVFNAPAANSASVKTTSHQTIAGIMVDGATALDAATLLPRYFHLIGQPATDANLDQVKNAIADAYRAGNYFVPGITIVAYPKFNNVFRVIVSEPVLMSFELVGGTSDARTHASELLNRLLGDYLISQNSFYFLESAISQKIGAKVTISPTKIGTDPSDFHLSVSLSGNTTGFVKIANEGSQTLGREILTAGISWHDLNSWLRKAHLSTLNTIKTDGYRSIGSGLQIATTALSEFNLESTISKAIWEIGGGIPNTEYDRTDFLLGWQTQLADSDNFKNGFFINLSLQNFEQSQTTIDLEEKLRIAQLGYWQSNYFSQAAFDWQLSLEQGLDSLGAENSGLLASTVTEIDFLKAEAEISYTQWLPKNVAIRTDLLVQYSDNYLPFSQRFAVASDATARAYESGEISGDSGIGLKLELSQGYDLALLSSRWTPYMYYGVGKVRDNLLSETTTAAAAGIGLRWHNRWFSAYAEVGKPLKEESIYRSDSARVQGSVTIWF